MEEKIRERGKMGQERRERREDRGGKRMNLGYTGNPIFSGPKWLSSCCYWLESIPP